MPSYLRNPYKSYSYPPTLEGIEEDYENNLPDIDEDPFAHFITPIDDEDPYDMSLSAGIMVAKGPRASKASKFKFNVADKWSRYVKQSHTGLHKQHHTGLHKQHHTPTIVEEEDEDEEESFMGLDDARLNERPSPVRHTTPPRGTTTESTRGRAPELVTRKLQNRRRNLRTLSGHRHSWRAPSPDLFTVDESEEDELPVLRRSRTRKAKDGAERRRSTTRSQSRMRGEMTERARL